MNENTNQETRTARTSLLDKAVDIEPSGVFYNMTSEIIENFVEDYLDKKGIRGISKVKMTVRNEGRTNPYIALYLFMGKNSNAVTSDTANIPPLLRKKIDTVNVSLNEDFKKILYPLCGNDISSGRTREGREFFVKMNIFRVVGIMLAADPGRHSLVISDAKRLPNGSAVISVVKGSNYNYGTGRPNEDNYARQIDYLESKHR